MPTSGKSTSTVHASCVAFGASAVLILGASGAGKSALALQLMALGGVLVADDRTILKNGQAGVVATCPKPIAGRIEARGIGILKADTQESAVIRLVVDMDNTETKRLPKYREIDLLGHKLPLLHLPKGPHVPAAIIQILKGGSPI